jgi:hypothetical protein
MHTPHGNGSRLPDGALAKSRRSELRVLALAALALVALVLLLFGEVLIASPGLVASHPEGDASRNFLSYRSFGFGELARGNLPLWNPRVFSGAPFLPAFQTALLYPPNVLYLLLPTERAIDLDFTLHVFLAGLFTFAWVRARGLHGLACLVAAVVLACGSAFSLRVLAGQLSLVAAMAWAPLLMLAVDKLFARPSLGWTLVGIASLTLQILAGYPVAAFSTGIAAALYAGLRLPGCERPLHVLGALTTVAIAPLFVSAAQLWPGLETAAETLRGGGISYAFATSFSFPPENFVTLWAPGFFGNVLDLAYWGRWYFWDATLFVGVLGLSLVLLGIWRGDRQAGPAALLLVLMVVLSLGRYTPFYGWLHAWVPGFDAFRAPSKFLFQASLFAALLAGIGADRLLRDAHGTRGLAILTGVWSLLLVCGALWAGATWTDSGGLRFGDLIRYMEDEKSVGHLVRELRWLAPELSAQAVRSLLLAAGTAVLGTGVLLVRRRRRPAAHVYLGLVVVELAVFALLHRGSFDPADARITLPDAVQARVGADERIFLPRAGNRLLESGLASVWGYDPFLLERYVALVAATQPQEFSLTEYSMRYPVSFHPLFAMLRCRLYIGSDAEDRAALAARRFRAGRGFAQLPIHEIPDPLPRFLLVSDHAVVRDDDTRLARLLDPAFDPRRVVLLEKEPDPLPARGSPGTGRIERLDASTDHVDLAVEIDAPALLLVTDAYSSGWNATALAPGPQPGYEVLPANHALMAIPLAAGSHRLRLEYAPASFPAGVAASLASSAALLMLAAGWKWRHRHDGRDSVRRGSGPGSAKR